MKNHSARLFKFQNDLTACLRRLVFFSAVAGFLSSALHYANAQTPGVLYTWPTAGNIQDWFHNFGAGTSTLSNPGGALVITETSATPGTTQAISDGFNTIRDTPATFASAICGGIDLTGLSSLEFVMGHNGVGNVNVQFYTQATPASTFVALGPDIPVAPGINTYSLPLTGLTADQIAYMRTIGINIRDHAVEGNLTWTIQEVRSVGTPLTSRVIADHDGGAADFDGVICNFDCGAVAGGNGGQNNSGMSIVSGALQWTDLGGSNGVAIAYGNGTQDTAGSFNARPVDLSQYETVTVRMLARGADPTLGVQFYMQTGSGFNYQSANSSLPVDGAFHDLVFPLAGITTRNFVDTSGVNLFGHTNDLVVAIDSVIYSVLPPTPCIQVVKQCAYPPNSPTCFSASSNIDFTGFVTNCGNTRLTNVTVIDSRPLLGSGLLDTNGSPLVQPLTLDPGQAVGFRGSFAPTLAETCASAATNGITARGTDVTPRDGPNISVTNVTSTTCAICVNPCLQVTKNCDSVVLGSPNTVSGVVSNCGNITITNIVISDNLYGTLATIPTLAPGASQSYSRPVTNNTCGNFPNTVTANGTNVCGQPITAQASSTCVVTANACLGVSKTCDTVTLGQPNTVTAVVTNCGNVTISGISVTDNLYGSLGNIPSLPPGASQTLSKVVTNNTCGNFTNVVTASGNSPCGQTPLSSEETDGTVTQVLARSTNVCVVTANSCLGVTKTCNTVTIGQPNTVTAVVTNCGNVVISGISVTDSLYGSIGTIASLAPGGSATLTKVVTNTCGTFTNVVTATGTNSCGAAVLFNENFNAGNGGFTVDTPVPYDGPWVYSAGTGSWTENGQAPEDGHPNTSTLISPAISVSQAGTLLLTFTHRYSFEQGNWDGGQVRLSVNGGAFTTVPLAAFTQNGYNGTVLSNSLSVLAGQSAYVENSPNFASQKLTSICTLGPFQAGDSIRVAFIAGNDTNTRGDFQPNWEIDDLTIIASQGTQVQASSTNVCVVTANSCITVTKNCGTVVVGSPITISGVVSNCGNITLTNVVLTDNLYGPVASFVSLAPGASQAYSKLVTNTCGRFANTVTATARSVCGTPVQASASAVCNVTENPCIRVTKTCNTVFAGQANTVTAVVTNCGDVSLHGITVVDNIYGSVGTIALLAPGGTATLTKSVTNTCGIFTNTVTATGLSPCNTTVTSTSTAICVVIDNTPPDINCPTNIIVGNDPGQCSAVVSYVANATDNCKLLSFGCFPPSGSVFPVGTTAVTCTATDAEGNTNTCTFNVTVEDREAPRGECREAINPSGNKIPVAGKNPSSGQNPDGYYELLAKDNCDGGTPPVIYLGDTGSSFIAGPFQSGDVIKLTQSPGKTPSQDSAPPPIVAHVHLKGDGLLFAVDASGNISEVQLCLVPRPPK